MPQPAYRSEAYVRIALQNLFQRKCPGTYMVRTKPKLRGIYSLAAIPEYIENKLYVPKNSKPRGIELDFSITNRNTGKTIFGEVKNQKGCIDKNTVKDGRGNAHERLTRYFSPGLLKIMRAAGNIQPPDYPFWVVLTGGITKDYHHNRELALWFEGAEGHYFMWDDVRDEKALYDHFQKHIAPLLMPNKD